jgi:hypothetical protein
MIKRLILNFLNRLDHETILLKGIPYLTRYRVINRKYLGLYIHHFHTEDGDRAQHSHPWFLAWTCILAGGYKEEVLRYLDARSPSAQVKYRKAGSINFIPFWRFHRIASITPDTWTLLLRFKKVQNWGFMDRESEGVLFYEYWKQWTNKRDSI